MLYQSKNPAPVEVAPSSEEITEGVTKLQAKTDHNLRYAISNCLLYLGICLLAIKFEHVGTLELRGNR